jgi:hypothetical protein
MKRFVLLVSVILSFNSYACYMKNTMSYDEGYFESVSTRSGNCSNNGETITCQLRSSEWYCVGSSSGISPSFGESVAQACGCD